ncbi:hypothetical protein P8452_56480 [Trifolium repens]|nr:hypothetical protein P8452_56480 [Trifolium repens]
MLLQTDKEWNLVMMQLYLSPQTMSEVDSTPLFASVVRDELIWHPNKYGEYSARSAYNFCLTELAAGAVPSVEAEHLLFFCEKSKMVWQNIGHWHQLHPFQLQQVIFAKMFSILSILPQEQQRIFAVPCWSIWSRNATTWENTRERAADIVQRGKCLLEEWRAVRIGPVQHENQPQPTVNRHPWQRPPPGFVKCNVDASFSKPLNKEKKEGKMTLLRSLDDWEGIQALLVQLILNQLIFFAS